MMDRIEVNTDKIVDIIAYDKADNCGYTIYPKNTMKKISWIERLLGTIDVKQKTNEKEAIIEVNGFYGYYWWTESEFLKENPMVQIIDGVVYSKPFVSIDLINGETINLFFKTYEECITIIDWLKEQNGYANLTNFKIKNNCFIKFLKK